MKTLPAFAAAFSLLALTACESATEKQADATEDRIEQQADASAAVAGATPAALGLSEIQLLDADLITADGTDLGDVEQVRRNASGVVDGLLIEVENSEPNRYVIVPMTGLTTRVQGDDTDLQATMTAADLAKLPDATLPAG